MTADKSFKVGLIIGSQRVVRIAPQVADFVLDTIKAHKAPSAQITFDRIDLAAQPLPLYDEPGIPNVIKSPEDYAHEHTRVWARRVAACDAFVFVSAQRNWGIPAELKNAIDYLFNEWTAKPALLITYGGHGGTQCAAQLKTVLGAIRMRVVDRTVNMSFPGPEFRDKAFKGQNVDLDATKDEGPWAEHRVGIATAFWDELVNKMLLI